MQLGILLGSTLDVQVNLFRIKRSAQLELGGGKSRLETDLEESAHSRLNHGPGGDNQGHVFIVFQLRLVIFQDLPIFLGNLFTLFILFF